jgi:FkbM family methyltransferase
MEDGTVDFFESYSEDIRSRLEEIKHDSTSQIGADLFVLAETNFKENGYFVDFGASDGISSSNTQLLETNFAWRGILAEPNLFFIDKLRQNRPNAVVVEKAVWKLSDEVLVFNETNNKDFSTIDLFSNSDWIGDAGGRLNGIKYDVSSISLNDLLAHNGAPREIDYLSIDTEGSEFEILSAFEFSNYRIRIITVEHNQSSSRDVIFDLLASKGYTRKLADFSKQDDWYVLDV